MTKATKKAKPEIGAQMADGSIYAGLTADGKSWIFAIPEDLDATMTFNNAVKAVNKLNTYKALGHDDWQIPTLDMLTVLQRHQDKGSLKGTFNTTVKGVGSAFPGCYWSSTEHRDNRSVEWLVRMSDNSVVCYPKDDIRLSCRPVRLAPANGEH